MNTQLLFERKWLKIEKNEEGLTMLTLIYSHKLSRLQRQRSTSLIQWIGLDIQHFTSELWSSLIWNAWLFCFISPGRTCPRRQHGLERHCRVVRETGGGGGGWGVVRSRKVSLLVVMGVGGRCFGWALVSGRKAKLELGVEDVLDEGGGNEGARESACGWWRE